MGLLLHLSEKLGKTHYKPHGAVVSLRGGGGENFRGNACTSAHEWCRRGNNSRNRGMGAQQVRGENVNGNP